MINAYRVRGHLLADLDPLEYKVATHPELDRSSTASRSGTSTASSSAAACAASRQAKLRDILDTLRETYCGKLAPEYMYIQETVQKRWLQDRMEPTRNKQPLDGATKRRILQKLNDAEAFERFLHTKYVGHKRFSLEGAESLIPMLDYLFNEAAADGVVEGVIGMAHRGRLNVLANTLGKSYEQIFREFEGDIDPNSREGSGDVKYHLGADGHARVAERRDDEAHARVESVPPRGRRSDRRRHGAREAEADRRPATARWSSPCCCTATPRSRDRASSRRR